MATLQLTDEISTVLDDADLEAIHEVEFRNGLYWKGAIVSRNWKLQEKPHTNYAICLLSGSFELRLHRVLMNARAHQIVDHKDGNGLNNVRSNLRITDATGNARNQRPQRGETFKGVSFHKQTGKYSAQIKVNKKKIHLGLFQTPEQAQAAYDAAAREHFGEFARPVLTATI